jgi:glycosyltransferase involved in cell wall biosynthesis
VGYGNGRRIEGSEPDRRLRIALLAAPMEPVPPVGYGGTERVVAALAQELTSRGHDVTVYASGDSQVAGRLEPIAPQALWRTGYEGDISAHLTRGVARCWSHADRFDVVHSHVEAFGFLFARHASVPVVSTLHGRLDTQGLPELLDEFADVPLVAISDSQRRWAPDANWVAVVHNGLPLDEMPFVEAPDDYLLFVGRIAIEKGIEETIELAHRVKSPLKIAAKVHDATERALLERVVGPVAGRDGIEYLGELPTTARDALFARAQATLMLGAWPEPFGLVAIESLACGTPVIARRAGALPEIVRHGVDGFLIDDLDEAEFAVGRLDRLDRRLIRSRALERFSASRMAGAYESIYLRLVDGEREFPLTEPDLLVAQP